MSKSSFQNPGRPSSIRRPQIDHSQVPDLFNFSFSEDERILRVKLKDNADLSSDDYVEDVSGWRITGNGIAEFAAGKFRGIIQAIAGVIGGWLIREDRIESSDSLIQLRPDLRRVEIYSIPGVISTAFGHLEGLEYEGGTFTSADYGLYIRPGSNLVVEGGGASTQVNTTFDSEGAIIMRNGAGVEIMKIGDIGGGNVGFKFGDGTNYLNYSLNDSLLEFSGKLIVGEGTIANWAITENTLSSGNLTISSTGFIEANYDAVLEQGWRLNEDGSAILNNVTVRGVVEASTGNIGSWIIDNPDIRDTDNRILMRPIQRRIEVRDALGVVKTAMGYLGGLDNPSGGTFDSTTFGFLLGEGNYLEITSGGEFLDGDYAINSDAAYVVKDAVGNEVARFGSIGVGDVGIEIGSVSSGSGLRYSVDDDTLEISGELQTATGTFAGELSAATGTFSGALEAATGTFSGTLDAVNITGAFIEGSQGIDFTGAAGTFSLSPSVTTVVTINTGTITASSACNDPFYIGIRNELNSILGLGNSTLWTSGDGTLSIGSVSAVSVDPCTASVAADDIDSWRTALNPSDATQIRVWLRRNGGAETLYYDGWNKLCGGSLFNFCGGLTATLPGGLAWIVTGLPSTGDGLPTGHIWRDSNGFLRVV